MLLDANSPEFGQKVDQITNMGRKEIVEASSHSNRFLDRPVKAMAQEGGVGTDLAQLRRVVEDLDPGKKGNLLAPKKISRHHSLWQQAAQLFRQLQVEPEPHQFDPRQPRLGQGRADQGQCRDRRRAAEHVGDDGQAGADDPHRQGHGSEARGQGAGAGLDPTRRKRRRSARARSSMCASATRTCSRKWP